MTKEEIVKALRYCADGESCVDCIYPNMGLPYLPCYQKDKDAADLIEAQAAEIEKLKAQVPGWIPVTERLPEVGMRVIVLDRRRNAMVRTLSQLAGEKEPSFRPDGLLPKWHITHWMPLPGVEV